MIDGNLLAAAAVAMAIYLGAVGVVHGVKKIGHGAKAVACKVHLATCGDDKTTK